MVVEPNYGHIFHDGETEAEASKALYDALKEVQNNYNVHQTQLIQFERKGKMVPNLYVYTDQSEQMVAKTQLEQPSS